MLHLFSSLYRRAGRIAVILVLGLATSAPAMAQVSCNNALSDSQNAYFNANFSAAIQILTFCIDQAIFDPFEEKEAYLLLSRVYFSVGQRENAEAAMEKVFELDALYVADPSFPPPLKDLIDEVRDRLADEGRLGTHTLTETVDPASSDSTAVITPVRPLRKLKHAANDNATSFILVEEPRWQAPLLSCLAEAVEAERIQIQVSLSHLVVPELKPFLSLCYFGRYVS